mgnify:CR=1 FL=1
MQALQLLSTLLQRNGYDVIVAQDGNIAIQAFKKGNPALIILDPYISYIDGYEVCRQVRQESETPIIIVSAQTNEQDKLMAFNLGVDDYLPKPFHVAELLARVRAVLRRCAPRQPESQESFRCAGLEIDFAARVVKRKDNPQWLTPIEFSLLQALVLSAGHVLTHQTLPNQV